MSRHALDRAKERYGVEMVLDDLIVLRVQIEGGKAVKLGETFRVARYLVTHQGTAMACIFDPVSRKIITFVPANSRTRPVVKRSQHVTAKGKRPPRREHDAW